MRFFAWFRAHPESILARAYPDLDDVAPDVPESFQGPVLTLEPAGSVTPSNEPLPEPVPETPPDRIDWTDITVQCRLLKRDAITQGRPLTEHTPKQCATRLLSWCQAEFECVETGCTITFEEVKAAYLEMCWELGWSPEPWLAVSRHFTKMTNGRKFRNAFDPRTGLRTAKERIYAIPPTIVARKPKRPGPAPGTPRSATRKQAGAHVKAAA